MFLDDVYCRKFYAPDVLEVSGDLSMCLWFMQATTNSYDYEIITYTNRFGFKSKLGSLDLYFYGLDASSWNPTSFSLEEDKWSWLCLKRQGYDYTIIKTTVVDGPYTITETPVAVSVLFLTNFMLRLTIYT